jgi:hypothetical protein
MRADHRAGDRLTVPCSTVQVFLTRSIIQVRSADSASGAAARLVAKLKNAANQTKCGVSAEDLAEDIARRRFDPYRATDGDSDLCI